MANYRQAVYDWVQRIPSGRVATYGQIAVLAGCTARQVGFALSQLPDDTSVPWHRIINRAGRISCRADGSPSARQRECLALESVDIGLTGKVDLDRYALLPLDAQTLLDVARVGLPGRLSENGDREGKPF